MAYYLSRERLIDEKIQALLDRHKPRDFYDLYFILRSSLIAAEKKAILPKTLEALRDQILILRQNSSSF